MVEREGIINIILETKWVVIRKEQAFKDEVVEDYRVSAIRLITVEWWLGGSMCALNC